MRWRPRGRPGRPVQDKKAGPPRGPRSRPPHSVCVVGAAKPMCRGRAGLSTLTGPRGGDRPFRGLVDADCLPRRGLGGPMEGCRRGLQLATGVQAVRQSKASGSHHCTQAGIGAPPSTRHSRRMRAGSASVYPDPGRPGHTASCRRLCGSAAPSGARTVSASSGCPDSPPSRSGETRSMSGLPMTRAAAICRWLRPSPYSRRRFPDTRHGRPLLSRRRPLFLEGPLRGRRKASPPEGRPAPLLDHSGLDGCVGITGWHASESVDDINRNGWTASVGTRSPPAVQVL